MPTGNGWLWNESNRDGRKRQIGERCHATKSSTSRAIGVHLLNLFETFIRSKDSGSQSPNQSAKSSEPSLVFAPDRMLTQSSYPGMPPQSSGGKARAPSRS